MVLFPMETSRTTKLAENREHFGSLAKKSSSWMLTIWIALLLSGTQAHAASVPVYAKNGMVVAQETIAAHIGAQVLREGGNAMDGAVATAFALAVTYPTAGNIGGGGFIMTFLPPPTPTHYSGCSETEWGKRDLGT